MTVLGLHNWTARQRRDLRIRALFGQPLVAGLGLVLFWGSPITSTALLIWAGLFIVPMITLAVSIRVVSRDVDRSDVWALIYRFQVAGLLGSLSWIEPSLAGITPYQYILAFAAVMPTASETVSTTFFIDRSRHYGIVVALMTVPHAAAFVVNGQWGMVGVVLIWVAIMRNSVLAGSLMREELERVHAEQRHEANHDVLTGLLNRKGFIERLDAANEGGHAVLIAVVDVDRFKLLNDSLGHRVGDLVLIELARRLVAELPMGSVVGRIGGDEFVALVPAETSIDQSRNVLDVAKRVEGTYLIDDHEVQVGVSIGVAPLRSGSEDPLADLAEADLAMYRRKRRRHERSASNLAAPAHHPRPFRANAVRRVEVERALRRGLAEAEERARAGGHAGATGCSAAGLRFVAQPIVDASTLAPVGVELLARLTDRAGNDISPAEFVAVADETGLVVDLGRRALDAAADLRARWAGTDYGHGLSVSINVSASHLGFGLVEDVKAVFPDGAHQLVIELIETQLVAEGTAVRAAMHRLKDLGAEIHIDDFGTGYSSLHYLLSLPIDAVKLDRAFVAGLEEDQRQKKLVAAIVTLSEALGVPCVAEGVERFAVIPHLREAGMSMLQGFAFGRPIECDEIDDALIGLGRIHTADLVPVLAPRQLLAIESGSCSNAVETAEWSA